MLGGARIAGGVDSLESQEGREEMSGIAANSGSFVRSVSFGLNERVD